MFFVKRILFIQGNIRESKKVNLLLQFNKKNIDLTTPKVVKRF